MEKEKIKFKPVHEGMGFHPFSDGLPYAPESKAKYQNGAGATAAGRPQFAQPQVSIQTINPSQARTQMRTARQIEEIKRAQVVHTAIKQPVLAKTVAAAPAQKKVTVNLDTLIRARAFAYLLDSVIHAGFWLGVNLAALFFFKFQLDAEIIRDSLPQFLIFFLVSQWMFIALQESLFETTMGKSFFKLEFERGHSSLFFRSIVFMVGALFFGAGFYFRPQDKLGELQLRS